jgi:hypothetical protein
VTLQQKPVARPRLTKKARLELALAAFSKMPQAKSYRQAIADMHEVLRQVESEHTHLPYREEHGHSGLQLHLFAFHPGGSFWQHSSEGNHVCQLVAHYAEFWPKGGVAIYTRNGNFTETLVYCKPDTLLEVALGATVKKEIWK